MVIAATAGSVVVWQSDALPDPATADRDGLLRWLVATDLAEQPVEVRATFLRRLDAEFPRGIDLSEVDDRLTPQQRERLWNNALLLLQQWFGDRVEVYSALAQSRRTEYLDATIGRLDAWSGLDALGPASSDGAAGSPSAASGGLWKTLMARCDDAKRSMDPEQQRRVDRFVAALTSRWLQHTLLGEPVTSASPDTGTPDTGTPDTGTPDTGTGGDNLWALPFLGAGVGRPTPKTGSDNS